MVLNRTRCLLPLLLLTACPRVPPQRLDTQLPIALAMVVDPAGSAPPLAPPPELFTQLQTALQTRNLLARTVPLQELGGQRLTEPRYQALKAAGDAPWVLLIEAQVNFFSQLDGRYRWLVSVKLSAGRRSAPGIEASDAFQAPAVLLYDHEREPEALLVVADVIADRATRMIDQLIVAPAKSLDADAGAAPAPAPPALKADGGLALSSDSREGLARAATRAQDGSQAPGGSDGVAPVEPPPRSFDVGAAAEAPLRPAASPVKSVGFGTRAVQSPVTRLPRRTPRS